MKERFSLVRLFVLIAFISVGLVGAAHAQVGSTCLRPLAIPDKWQEAQTPPWDIADTYDGSPDVYRGPLDPSPTGYAPAADQGRYLELRLNSFDPLQAHSALAVNLGGSGGSDFTDDIVQCSGTMVAIGFGLQPLPGDLRGPLMQAIETLIAQDQGAFWDPLANGGHGDVAGSAFTVSPRVIALPVFDTELFFEDFSVGLITIRVVRIVGFFVAGIDAFGTVQGYLTGVSHLATENVFTTVGGTATLASTLTGPGAPISGISVDFSVDGNPVGTGVTDTTGRAELTDVTFPGFGAGTFPDVIAAALGSDAGFFTAAADTANLSIDQIASTTSLSSSVNPSVFGQSVTFTATVSTASEIPTGTVTFRDGAQTLATVVLTGGSGSASAAFTTSSLTVNAHAISAQYNGSTAVAPSTSNGVTQTVGAASTTTTLVSLSPNPSKSGDPISLRATVAVVAPGTGVPTGSVTFLRNGQPLGNATLVNGVANFTTSPLAGGQFTFTARFEPGAGYATSTSTGLVQTVKGKK